MVDNKQTFRIKAAFVDCIDRIDFYQKYLKKINDKIIQRSFELNSLSKDELISLLNDSLSYTFEDDEIIIDRYFTESEKIKEKEHYLEIIRCNVSRLIGWCNQSKENTDQIHGYIKRHSLINVQKELDSK